MLVHFIAGLWVLPIFIAIAVESSCGNLPVIARSDAIAAAWASKRAYSDALYDGYQIDETSFTVTKIIKNTQHNVLVYVADSGNTRMISFRGTASFQQLNTQFLAGLVNVMQDNNVYVLDGQNTRILSFIWSRLGLFESGLDSLLNDASKKYIITGHSLGGALASLFALKTKIYKPSVWTNPESCLITFGAPRLGDRDFAALHDEKIPAHRKLRIVNRRDPVPHIPVSLNANDNFEHHSRELWLSSEYLTGLKKGRYGWKSWRWTYIYPPLVTANKACGPLDPRNCNARPRDCSNCLQLYQYWVSHHDTNDYIDHLKEAPSLFYDKNGQNRGTWEEALKC